MSCSRFPVSSILSPFLFLLYINYFLDDVISNINIYADDTTLYPFVARLLICAKVLRECCVRFNSDSPSELY